MGKTYLPPRLFTCLICKKEYKRYGNSPSVYCSNKCKHQGLQNKIELKCMNCNKSYEIPKSQKKWADIRKRTKTFCSKECNYEYKRIHHCTKLWKSGKHITGRGYIKIWKPLHPNNINGYCYEHRIVMEQHLGRYLTYDEVIHHKNKNKGDNRIENLELMTRADHCGLHSKQNWQSGALKKSKN